MQLNVPDDQITVIYCTVYTSAIIDFLASRGQKSLTASLQTHNPNDLQINQFGIYISINLMHVCPIFTVLLA